MEEGGTAAAANYISFKCCATTPRALVLISDLLKSPLGWSQEQAMLFIGYSGYSWAGGGVFEVLAWKLLLGEHLAKLRMLPRSLDSSGKVKPVIMSSKVCSCRVGHNSALPSNLQSFCPASSGTYRVF